MKIFIAIILILITSFGFCQRDSLIASEKFNIYALGESNYIPEANVAFFSYSGIGIGINFKELKIEASFPFSVNFYSRFFFKPSFKFGLGFNFIARKKVTMSILTNYLFYQRKERIESFDYVTPSLTVPINYVSTFKVNNFDLMLRYTRIKNESFKWFINMGISFYEMRTTALMDSDKSLRIIDGGRPNEPDYKLLSIGFGINYKFYEK